jgi:hypothetical protein
MVDRFHELQLQDVTSIERIQILVDAGIDPDEAAIAMIGGPFRLSEATREAFRNAGR